MQFWSDSGFTKSKLVAGIPFYGRGWLLNSAQDTTFGSDASGWIPASQYTRELRVWPFYEICMRIKSDNATYVYNDSIQASYAYSDAWWIGYNDVRTIRTKVDLNTTTQKVFPRVRAMLDWFVKVKWLRDNEYGGVFAWDITQDDYGRNCGYGANPLLQAIKDGIN